MLVCDKGNPRNAFAHESHSFFTRDGINPHELLNIGRDQLKPYKSVEFQAIGVKEIKPFGNQFDVVFKNGTVEKSHKILLAFGVIDEFPDIENFGEFWGKSVFHCPYWLSYSRGKILVVSEPLERTVPFTVLDRSLLRSL